MTQSKKKNKRHDSVHDTDVDKSSSVFCFVLFFVLVVKLQVPAHYRRNATTFTRSSNQLKFQLIKSNSLHICLQTAHYISPFGHSKINFTQWFKNFVVIINRGVQPFFFFFFYSITGTVIKPQWRPSNLLHNLRAKQI